MREKLKRSLSVIALLAATACDASPKLELLSRNLLEGPVRAALICEKGTVIASGGAVYVIPKDSCPTDGILIHLDGEPWSLAERENIVYIAVDKFGLVTLDISDPHSPAVKSSHRAKGAYSLALQNKFLVLSDNGKGLLLFDISEDLTPQLIGSIGPGMPGRLLSSDGEHIVAVTGSRAEILHIDGNDEIRRLSSIDAQTALSKGYIQGEILYLLTKQGNVLRYNLADFSSPATLSPFVEQGVRDIHLSADRGLMFLGNGRIIPFSAGKSRDRRAGAGTGDENPTYSLMIKDGVKLHSVFPGISFAAGPGGLVTFGSIKECHLFSLQGDQAEFLGSFASRGFAIDLTARDGYVYLANGKDGLRTGRISQEGTIEWMGHIQTDEARDVSIEGDILVLADGGGGTRFFSLEDPAVPEEIGRIGSPFFICSIVTRDSKAYLGGGLGGAEIVDFSDPESPSLVWREKFSEVRGLDTDGEFLYLCDGFEGLRIYSLNQRIPVQVSQVNTPGWTCDAFVTGDILCLADGGNGIMTVDISDRSSPEVLGTAQVGSIAREIHVKDKTLFVASNIAGLTAIDISNPAMPVVTARHASVDDGRGVFADGRFVFLASGSGGLYIFRYGN